MGSRGRQSKGDRSSIKYRLAPLDVQSFKPVNICSSGDGCAQHSVSHTKEGSQSEVKSSTSRVTTTQFVSAAAGLWGRVVQPEDFPSKANSRYNICQKENIIPISNIQRKYEPNRASPGTEIIRHDFKSASMFSSTARSNFEDFIALKKTILFASCNRNIRRLFIDSVPHAHIDCSNDPTNNSDSTRKDSYPVGKDDSFMVSEKSSVNDQSVPPSTENRGPTEGLDCFTGESLKLSEYVLDPLTPRYASYSIQPLKGTDDFIRILRNSSLGLHSDYNIEGSTSVDCATTGRQKETDSCIIVSGSSVKVCDIETHDGHGSRKGLCQELVADAEPLTQDRLFIQDKFRQAFAHKRHALAGALAGTLVSLCLHPIDTVKTVIQSNGMGQKSYYDILRTIVAEKGVFGLYRGIASNIASSAPISAIYTYTYESVKGALLPILPKEYHSFAHCTAGGCSSIATSFIFTPSDRIKQQMQVGSQYTNCWNALIGCLGKGGVPSLYTGWGAVLCRNIPHSIIKFYTYERLKQFFSRSASPDCSLKTLQTLVCGGLAGSTAALFTTPFDVVKTRLQTQAPGSRGKYNGVLHALQEIAREEGLQGLYRGLPPRLAMYVSQGAIFFASYEFLRAVFSFESPNSPITIFEEEKSCDPAPSTIYNHNANS